MEVSALKYRSHLPAAGLRGPTPLLRLQGDERLVALTRRGNQAAYEALVARYQARLLAFCRHMLSSREDAEDVLQEVFAAAFNAMTADTRPINVRPWLYRIARNRCLNHLRRQTAIGVDSMDVHLAENGTTTADKVHDREDFRQLVADVQTLAETQRTALLLREIDALSYEQIAEAMETTVPSVKSLLVRARVALAEAAESRMLTCDDVRAELGEWAEGLTRVGAPARRHIRTCDQCARFKKQLAQTNKALAALFPVGPLLILKNLLLAHGAHGAAAGASGTAAATGGATAGGALTFGAGAVATKAAAGLAVAAIVTTGAVEAQHVTQHHRTPHRAVAAKVAPARVVAPAPAPAVVPAPVAVRSEPQPQTAERHAGAASTDADAAEKRALSTASSATPSTAVPAATTPAATAPPQEGFANAQLPAQAPTETPAGAATPAAAPVPAATAAPSPPDVAPAPAAAVTAQSPPAADPVTAPTQTAAPTAAESSPAADPTTAAPASSTAPATPVAEPVATATATATASTTTP